MISLARTSSFCWVSPCTFCRSVAPRISASPALRTLFAIILAASARSYRRPDSSPVASGCSFSCSMMKRSIVTTEVAVCLTTEAFLVGGMASKRDIPASIYFVGVTRIAVTEGLQEITYGERPFAQKLMDVAELVQEQRWTEWNVSGKKHGTSQSYGVHTRKAECPAAEAHR